uniref:Uncharacterized protein n=1 Tax=Mycena chlorophos TaxID=658473 RepID=A0ABQ0LKN3_MYCCL|nr:predicted protein [Mycena chlorophos]
MNSEGGWGGARLRMGRLQTFSVHSTYEDIAFCEHPLFQECGEQSGRWLWCPRRSWSRPRPQRPQGNVPKATNSAMKSSWEDEKASGLTGCNAFVQDCLQTHSPESCASISPLNTTARAHFACWREGSAPRTGKRHPLSAVALSKNTRRYISARQEAQISCEVFGATFRGTFPHMNSM